MIDGAPFLGFSVQRQSASPTSDEWFVSRDDDASTVRHCLATINDSRNADATAAAAAAAVCWPATLDRAALEKQELYETIRRLREALKDKSDELRFLRESWATLQEGTVTCDAFQEMKERLCAENARLSQRVAELEDTCSELRRTACTFKRDVHIPLTVDLEPVHRPPAVVHPVRRDEVSSTWCRDAAHVVTPQTHTVAPTKHAAVQSVVETRCDGSQTIHVRTLDAATGAEDSGSPPRRFAREVACRHVHCQTSALAVAAAAPPLAPLQPVSVVPLLRGCRHVGIQCSSATWTAIDMGKPPSLLPTSTAHRPLTAVRHAAVQATQHLSDITTGQRKSVATQTASRSSRKESRGPRNKLMLTLATVHQRLEQLRSEGAEYSGGARLVPDAPRGPLSARLFSLPKLELIVPAVPPSVTVACARSTAPLLQSDVEVTEDNGTDSSPAVNQASREAQRVSAGRRSPRHRSVSPLPNELIPRAAVQIPVPVKRMRSCGTSPLQQPTPSACIETREEYLEKRWQRAQSAFLESLQHIQGENVLLRQLLFRSGPQ